MTVVASMAYCRVESIDPESKELVYLRKRKSDRNAQSNHRGLLEALERASTIRHKEQHPADGSEHSTFENSKEDLPN